MMFVEHRCAVATLRPFSSRGIVGPAINGRDLLNRRKRREQRTLQIASWASFSSVPDFVCTGPPNSSTCRPGEVGRRVPRSADTGPVGSYWSSRIGHAFPIFADTHDKILTPGSTPVHDGVRFVLPPRGLHRSGQQPNRHSNFGSPFRDVFRHQSISYSHCVRSGFRYELAKSTSNNPSPSQSAN